jgi:hypothetical protein
MFEFERTELELTELTTDATTQAVEATPDVTRSAPALQHGPSPHPCRSGVWPAPGRCLPRIPISHLPALPTLRHPTRFAGGRVWIRT